MVKKGICFRHFLYNCVFALFFAYCFYIQIYNVNEKIYSQEKKKTTQIKIQFLITYIHLYSFVRGSFYKYSVNWEYGKVFCRISFITLLNIKATNALFYTLAYGLCECPVFGKMCGLLKESS